MMFIFFCSNYCKLYFYCNMLLLLSGFFDKAKKKILRDRDVDSNPFSQQFSADDCEQMVTLTGYDSSWRKPQELGWSALSNI